MAIEAASKIRDRLIESGKRLQQVRQTAEREKEKQRDAEPTPIQPTATSLVKAS